MIYSPHTFEITLNLDTSRFDKLKARASKKAKRENLLVQDKNKDIDYTLIDKGIKIEYPNDIYKKRIQFIVNPSKLLGGDDVKKLWKPNADKITRLLHKLEKSIDNYFDSKYSLNDFNLTRIDFTVNIELESREYVLAYIKVLRNIGKVKCFSPKYDKNDPDIEKELSFDLKGNSNGVEFTAYDKEAQSKRKEAKGILRVEVRLTKPKTIRKYAEEATTSKQIMSLAANSSHIFLDTFSHVVPRGDYFKMKDAVKLVKNNIHKKKHREKMLRLIKLIPTKKSLYLAQKGMNDRNIDKVMEMFKELNLSPVTLSKRHSMNYLESLYVYLFDKQK